MLLSTAAYSAAKANDRGGSRDLLDTAEAGARRLHGVNAHWTGFGESGVTLYRISSSLVLGDAGTAIAHARTIRPGELPTTERRARYWVDVARAFSMWGKHEDCYRALLAAERAAPEETHCLPVVRTLVTTLLANQHRCAMPGLRELAVRCALSGLS